jgi:L-rhamnose mutarotase
MKRVGFLLKVREEYIEEYKTHHQNVWEEMKNALVKHGWNNYSLFIRPDGLLFGYFEASESFSKSLAGMSEEQINTEWQEVMSPYFEILESSTPDLPMVELDEVFHLD